MKKYSILALLLVLVAGLCASIAFAQTTASVKGVAKDIDGKPIAQAGGEGTGTETGHKNNLKTNNKGEYFSLGILPGKYNVKLSKDGKEIFHFNNIVVTLDEATVDFDMKKEQAAAAKGAGMTPEEAKARADAAAKAEAEKKTVGSLNDKLNAAKTASDAGDFETAISTLNEANQMDPTRDLIWFKLGDAFRMSAPRQTDPDEKKKRYEMAAADYQKAIDLRTASDAAKKDADNNQKMAAYYNNLAEVDAQSNKVDDAVANYTKAADLDSAHAVMYLFNAGRILTNCGQGDKAISAFDKVGA